LNFLGPVSSSFYNIVKGLKYVQQAAENSIILVNVSKGTFLKIRLTNTVTMESVDKFVMQEIAINR
jgi:hypothetical protein